MNIQITARKFKAHGTLKEFIKDELSSLEKFNDDIISADVVLSYQNNVNSVKKVEVVLSIPGQLLNAADQNEEFKVAVSAVAEKLRRQLKTIKSKRVAKSR